MFLEQLLLVVLISVATAEVTVGITVERLNETGSKVQNYSAFLTECYCGENAASCVIYEEQKICVCNYGYADKSGMCERCFCGSHAEMCFLDGDGKQCVCEKGYKFQIDMCAECNCGMNSTDCFFNGDGEKSCNCKDGNAEKSGICTHCDCGPDSKCSFTSSDEKECECTGPLCRGSGNQWFRSPTAIAFYVALCGLLIFGILFVTYRKFRSNVSPGRIV